MLGLGALLALADVELHSLVLVETAVSVHVDGRVGDEDVRSAPVRGDKAGALLAAEPLHAALSHVLLPGETFARMPHCAAALDCRKALHQVHRLEIGEDARGHTPTGVRDVRGM